MLAFTASPEHAALDPGEGDLRWIDELLDTMQSAVWGWADLDLELFEAVLLDGFGWTIECAPDDPARVARVLDVFLSFAAREYGAPHAPACCEYLRSPAAVDDIARWVRPFDDLCSDPLFAALSAPYNWCDGRCERCPLAPRCPVHNFDLEPLRPVSADDREGVRAAALAAAHSIAARQVLEALEDRAGPGRPREPEPPAAARLRHSCREYAFAVIALRDALADVQPERDLGELRADAMLVAVKGGRVAGYLSDMGALEDEAALMDGVPNLLLIERIMAEIERCLADRSQVPGFASAYRAARDELRDLLRPHLRCVPSCYRDEIRSRVLIGGAPSPFSVSP